MLARRNHEPARIRLPQAQAAQTKFKDIYNKNQHLAGVNTAQSAIKYVVKTFKPATE